MSEDRTYLREVKFTRAGKWFVAIWGVAIILFILGTSSDLLGAVLFEPEYTKVP